MMNKKKSRINILLLSMVFPLAISFLYGQEKPAPPKREGAVPVDTTVATDQKLPQIDLPEFQITGNERIDLPQFSKPSLEEDNVFDASGWKPGPGRRENSSLDIGGGIKNQVNFGGTPASVNGKAIVGYGSYQTPFLDGWFGQNFGTFDFLLKSGYTSSRGFHPNSDYRKAHGSLSGGTYLSNETDLFAGARINGIIGFRGEGYGLYGSDVPQRERTVNGFLSDVVVSSAQNAPLTYTSGLHLQATTVSDSIRTSETLLGFDVSANKDVDGFDVKGDFNFWSSFYSAPSKTNNPYHSVFSLSVRRTIGDRFDVSGGIGVYFARGSDTKSITRLYPRIGAAWYANDWMMLFARYEPFLQRNELAPMMKTNPYLVNDIRIRHQEVFHNISFGVEAELAKEIKGRVSLNHRLVRNQPIFVDGASRGLWTAEYAGVTRTISFEASVYADITSRDHLAGSFELRANKNSVTEKRIPYYPSALVSGLYRHTFPFGLALGANMQLVGQQYTDVQNALPIKAFVLFDFIAEYAVGYGFGVNGTVNNAFNKPHRWWQGYQATPRAASLALTYSW
ncbi:MAG: hypothetical protein ACKVRP_05700 [Bacteroidota bacterium]